MLRPLVTLRVSAAAVGLAGAIFASGVAIGPQAIADYQTLRATTAVNVRTGPSTSSGIIGVLYLNNTVKQTGPVQSGWVPVTFNGRKAWVSANYLTGVRANETAPASQSGTSGTKVAQEALNVRSGPSISARKVGLVDKGRPVTLTGLVSGNYVQIVWKDGRAWVARAWLKDAGSSTPTTTAPVKGQARATTALMIRTAPGTNFRSLGDIPTGTVLNLTGRTSPGVAEIIWQGSLRWVNANFLAAVGGSTTVTTPSLPAVVGTQYATAALDIRTSSGSDSRTLSEVPAGTALSVTGTVKNGRAQIVYQGAVRWVTARYLSARKPSAPIGGTTPGAGANLSPTYGGSSGLTGLPSNTQNLLVQVRTVHPEIKTIYGIRADAIPDHPSGHALDLMIPSWSTSSGNALGWEVARWARAHADELDIQYIIFDQQIWNRARDGEGWRRMADRGGATANHRDHVHITTRG